MAADARLAAGLWVVALLRRLSQEAIPVYVLAHGDDTAGDVQVKSVTPWQTALWSRQWDLASDSRVWNALTVATEAEADAILARARVRDPDLWLLEVEITPERLAALLKDMG